MDDRIINDPHLEIIPDHADAHYNVHRNALTQNGMTADEALQALNDSWTQNHAARVQGWDLQVENDAAAAQGGTGIGKKDLGSIFLVRPILLN